MRRVSDGRVRPKRDAIAQSRTLTKRRCWVRHVSLCKGVYIVRAIRACESTGVACVEHRVCRPLSRVASRQKPGLNLNTGSRTRSHIVTVRDLLFEFIEERTVIVCELDLIRSALGVGFKRMLVKSVARTVVRRQHRLLRREDSPMQSE